LIAPKMPHSSRSLSPSASQKGWVMFMDRRVPSTGVAMAMLRLDYKAGACFEAIGIPSRLIGTIPDARRADPGGGAGPKDIARSACHP
jgi:hypothetical protein